MFYTRNRPIGPKRRSAPEDGAQDDRDERWMRTVSILNTLSILPRERPEQRCPKQCENGRIYKESSIRSDAPCPVATRDNSTARLDDHSRQGAQGVQGAHAGEHPGDDHLASPEAQEWAHAFRSMMPGTCFLLIPRPSTAADPRSRLRASPSPAAGNGRRRGRRGRGGRC
jgi:hypothetical protein